MKESYDVLVVGAGPAGSAAARKCVGGGLKTLLIEKHKLPRRKACSGIIANKSYNYVLENFGPIGAWRLYDGDSPVDATGQLADGTEVGSPADLREALMSRSGLFVTTLTEKLMMLGLDGWQPLNPSEKLKLEAQ